MHDDRTHHRGYPLPHPDNYIRDDQPRIRDTIVQIDGDIGRFDDHRTDPEGHPTATQTAAGFLASEDKAKLDAALVEDDVIALILALG